jgi:hypothetical protein
MTYFNELWEMNRDNDYKSTETYIKTAAYYERNKSGKNICYFGTVWYLNNSTINTLVKCTTFVQGDINTKQFAKKTYTPFDDIIGENALGACRDTYLLAWTTTPWTLPSNTALCVGPKIEYV